MRLADDAAFDLAGDDDVDDEVVDLDAAVGVDTALAEGGGVMVVTVTIAMGIDATSWLAAPEPSSSLREVSSEVAMGVVAGDATSARQFAAAGAIIRTVNS